MIADPIADMITRLKNAVAARCSSVELPYSNLRMEIAKVLAAEGYIGEPIKKGKKVKKNLELPLVYGETGAKIRGVERVSKLSRRVYAGVNDLRPFKQGFGQLIISTSRGILTGQAARAARVGGEILFKIW